MRFLLVPILALIGCGGGTTPKSIAQLGDPMPGLGSARLAAFDRGKALFAKRFTRTDGHGPDFNTSSCMSCHEFPTIGGSSPLYRNFFMARKNGVNYFDDDQLVARTFSYTRAVRERIGPDADTVAQRNAPPMFGIGQLRHITDSEIRENADPFDDDGDGISGKANFDLASVGRFGYKAQEANLEEFIRGPIFNHMGITTDPLSFSPLVAGLTVERQVSAPDEPTTDDDGVPDPELGAQDLFDLLVFNEELAPPQPLPMDSDALRGEQLFLNTIDCAKCHIPNLKQTGNPILAYSDLLVHYMGIGLADGIVMGLAQGNEFRTQPLWGARHHAPYMHDGRADTLEDAILLHDGEGRNARNAFTALSPADRAAVIKFLETR